MSRSSLIVFVSSHDCNETMLDIHAYICTSDRVKINSFVCIYMLTEQGQSISLSALPLLLIYPGMRVILLKPRVLWRISSHFVLYVRIPLTRIPLPRDCLSFSYA